MNKRIADREALDHLRELARREIDVRAGAKEFHVVVHMGTCGIAAGARDILVQFMNELGQANLHNVSLRQTGCAGLCDQEPMLTLIDRSGAEYRYGKLDAEKVRVIVQRHLIEGQPASQYLVQV